MPGIAEGEPGPPLDGWRIAAEPFYRPLGREVAAFEAAASRRLPILLTGPTGCGKTRFVEHMAWRRGKPLVTVACNEDTTAGDLVGRWLLDAEGTREMVESFTRSTVGTAEAPIEGIPNEDSTSIHK